MNYNVEFGYGAAKYTKTFSSIEELKDYCCQNWGVERFQVKIDNDGNIRLNNKLGGTFVYVGKVL